MTETRKATYNIVLVDDHPILWDGLKLMLERNPRLRVVGTHRDGTALLRASELKQCDMVILDIGLPRMDGFSVLEKLNSDHPDVAVLIFTMHTNLEFFSKAIGMGVKGYVLKRDPPETLLTAVKNIMIGKMGISPSISPMLMDPEYDPEYDEALKKLTARELEVLSLVASGMTSRDIARTLNVKKSTIDKHRENIRAKLGTNNLTELIYIARKNRLI